MELGKTLARVEVMHHFMRILVNARRIVPTANRTLYDHINWRPDMPCIFALNANIKPSLAAENLNAIIAPVTIPNTMATSE